MKLSPSLVDQFYRTRHGAVAASLLRERLSLFWPQARGLRVLGIGHARPFLPLWHEEASYCLDMVTSLPSDGAWSGARGGRSAVVDEEALPFPDLSVDRILLIHGLEVADDAQRLLRECWRLLRDDGRLLVVTPNRVGVWAHVEATPFGQGEPYTQGQVERLLRAGMFTVERRDTALFLPPVDNAFLLGLAAFADRVGRVVSPRLAGVQIVDAVKDVYAALPGRPVTQRVVRPAVVSSALGIPVVSSALRVPVARMPGRPVAVTRARRALA